MAIIADGAAAIITPGELVSYLPADVDTSNAERVDMLVEFANGLVTDLIGEQTSYSWRARAITLEIAARPLRNPNGYSSETVDDYTYRLPTAVREAGIYATADERAELLGTVGKVRGTAYSVAIRSPLDIA